MHKVRALAEGFGLAAILAVLVAGIAHGLARDALLFQSDALSLATYMGAVGLIGGLALTLASSPTLLLPEPVRTRLRHLLRLCGLAVMLMIFLTLAIVLFGGVFKIEVVQKLVRNPEDFIAIVVAPVLALSCLVAWRKRKDDIAHRRIHALAVLAAVFVAVGLPISVAARHASKRAAPNDAAEHLVLIVLDGMPSQYLATHNHSAVPTLMDKVVDSGLSFTGARTSTPFTWGYFGTLYSGAPDAAFSGPKGPLVRRLASLLGRGQNPNLIQTLQRAGVSARWMAFHRNGTPEASSAETGSYGGLRSYFLTQRHAWLPGLLALDYHLTIAGDAIRQALRGSWARTLFDVVNPDGGLDNRLLDDLLPEMRRQAASGRPSFTLFHTGWDRVGRPDIVDDDDLPAAWRLGKGSPVDHSPTEQIRTNDYQYAPENEPLAADLRRRNLRHMEVLGRHLQDFLSTIAVDPVLRDATLIVTADHGSMYGKGRFWYGFHPNEEVIRVPLVVFGAERTGIDDRMLQTADLTASILDFFDVRSATDGAISIFGDGTREWSAAATMRSDVHNEWFLVLRGADRKYVMNIHPNGDGTTTTVTVDGYEERVEGITDGAPDEIADTFRLTTVDFGLDLGELHPAFRPSRLDGR